MQSYIDIVRKQLKNEDKQTWFVAQPLFITNMRKIFFIEDRVRQLCKKAFETLEEFGGAYALKLQARKSIVIAEDKKRTFAEKRRRKREEKLESKSTQLSRLNRTQAQLAQAVRNA